MLLLCIVVIFLTSLVIYWTGEHFSTASSNIGDYFGLSRSAKGATLDAISSSAPELSVSLISVILFFEFEVGIGTIVGSALFNVLLIPAACVFAAPIAFEISDQVVHRDGLFYIITLMIFLMVFFFSEGWTIETGILLVGVYIFYIFEVFRRGKIFKKGENKDHKQNSTTEGKNDPPEINLPKNLVIFSAMLILILVASYFLVEYSIKFAEIMGIPPIIIAFTVIAAASSVPDMVVSMVNSRKGDVTDATSNVFGSNIFDILMGLGLPIIIASILGVPIETGRASMVVVFGLLVSTVVVVYLLAEDMKLTKTRAIMMILIYIGLVSYVVVQV